MVVQLLMGFSFQSVFVIPEALLKGLVEWNIGDMVGVIADQLEGRANNGFQHLGLGKAGAQDSFDLGFGNLATLLDDGGGKGSER